MKHTPSVTAILVGIFVITQIFGLYAINYDLQVYENPQTGELTLQHPDTAIGERPQIQDWSTVIYVALAIGIGTMLVMLIVRFRTVRLWKLWFFLAVWLTISITFGVFMQKEIAYAVAFILALIKIFRHNPFLHNVTEILMYTGIAVLIVPLLQNPLWALVLLLVISAYDIIAVWKSKHMVKMAKFQTKSKLFAGLLVPYGRSKHESKEVASGKHKNASSCAIVASSKESNAQTASSKQDHLHQPDKNRNAILGGGDIAFPLIFAGSVMEYLITGGIEKSTAFFLSAIIALTSAGSLLWLFVMAKKDKFYPAMPFITGGCILGAAIVFGINALV